MNKEHMHSSVSKTSAWTSAGVAICLTCLLKYVRLVQSSPLTRIGHSCNARKNTCVQVILGFPILLGAHCPAGFIIFGPSNVKLAVTKKKKEGRCLKDDQNESKSHQKKNEFLCFF